MLSEMSQWVPMPPTTRLLKEDQTKAVVLFAVWMDVAGKPVAYLVLDHYEDSARYLVKQVHPLDIL